MHPEQNRATAYTFMKNELIRYGSSDPIDNVASATLQDNIQTYQKPPYQNREGALSVGCVIYKYNKKLVTFFIIEPMFRVIIVGNSPYCKKHFMVMRTFSRQKFNMAQ